jgi:hypothetical protein
VGIFSLAGLLLSLSTLESRSKPFFTQQNNTFLYINITQIKLFFVQKLLSKRYKEHQGCDTNENGGKVWTQS